MESRDRRAPVVPNAYVENGRGTSESNVILGGTGISESNRAGQDTASVHILSSPTKSRLLNLPHQFFPNLLAEPGPEVRHQPCVSCVLNDINIRDFNAHRRLRRKLASKRGRQRHRGRPSQAQQRASNVVGRPRRGKRNSLGILATWLSPVPNTSLVERGAGPARCFVTRRSRGYSATLRSRSTARSIRSRVSVRCVAVGRHRLETPGNTSIPAWQLVGEARSGDVRPDDVVPSQSRGPTGADQQPPG